MIKFEFDSGILNGGLNNADDDTLIQNNQLADCQNVIFDEKGFPEKRPPVFTMNKTGKEWKTGITENGETIYVENLYTYKKRDGSQYLIAFAGTEIKYTQNLSDWYSLNPPNVSFSTIQKMNFCTFMDKLIITNGIDNVYYWDGAMQYVEKIGAPVLSDAGSGSNVTNGVHKCKITYEINGEVYHYNVNSNINITNNHNISISNIPLGSMNFDTGSRRLWITTANTDVYYLLGNKPLSDTDTTATFNISDTTLATYTSYASYISGKTINNVQVPKCRFFEVFENSLFGAHSSTAPSEVYWSEPNSFEDFPLLNVLAINIDDGEYITAIKNFKAMNQLLVWKKSSMYGVFTASDTYIYKSLLNIGCTFADSIQEMNITDEYGTRNSILFANSDGIWEWTGNTAHLISDQPNGSSIKKLWSKAKQREMEFKKNIRTTTADFSSYGSISGKDNWLEIGDNKLQFKNIFDWYNSNLRFSSGLACWCFNPNNKKIYAMADGASGSYPMHSYYWDGINKKWIDEGEIISYGIGFPVKMEYDPYTQRIYVICSNGYIYRTNTSLNNWDGYKIFNINTLSGTRTIKLFLSGLDNNKFRTITFYVPYKTNVSFKADSNITFELSRPSYRLYYSSLGSTPYVRSLEPGLYYAYITWGSSNNNFYISYDYQGNIDMAIYDKKLFFIDHPSPSSGTQSGSYITYPPEKHIIKYIDLTNWNAGIQNFLSESYQNYSTHYLFLISKNNNLYWTAFCEDKTNVNNIAYIKSSNGTTISQYKCTDYRYFSGGYYEFLKFNCHFTSRTSFYFGQIYELHNNKYYIFTYDGNTLNKNVSEITIYDNDDKNIPINVNTTKGLFYYINNSDKKIYEYSMSGNVNNLESPPGGITAPIKGFLLCSDLGIGIPDQILIKAASPSYCYYRGIVGNYILYGNWLSTGTGKVIDTGENSEFLNSIEIDEVNTNENSFFKYYIGITTTTNTISTSEFTQIQPNVILEGTKTNLTLKGNMRYIHQYITGQFNIYYLSDSLNSTFRNFCPYIEGIITNWINWETGTTIPKTEVVSKVFENKYYISFVERKTMETSKNAELTNNVIAVLDRFKRWTVWRGRGCYASAFSTWNNSLCWGDCYIDSDDNKSDYIYFLGIKSPKNLADYNVTTSEYEPINAYIITKNYNQFHQYDDGAKKKKIRHMYITSLKFIKNSENENYNLIIGYRKDDEKYTEANSNHYINEDKFTLKYLDVGHSLIDGKINLRIDFPNEQPGKRYQFMFANNIENQDLGLIRFILIGQILHRRD